MVHRFTSGSVSKAIADWLGSQSGTQSGITVLRIFSITGILVLMGLSFITERCRFEHDAFEFRSLSMGDFVYSRDRQKELESDFTQQARMRLGCG